MSGQKYMALPKSRNSLRDLAFRLRARFGMQHEWEFPIVEFFELVFCVVWDYDLRVIHPLCMPENHADTDPCNRIIRIREDVYTGAISGHGRDRFTIAHEIGHVLLEHDAPTLARIDPSVSVPAYKDPEWQANAFAGELLMPYHLARSCSVDEIASRCKVTTDAARTQWKAFHKE